MLELSRGALLCSPVGHVFLHPRCQSTRGGNVRKREMFHKHKHKHNSLAEPERCGEKKNAQLRFFSPALLIFQILKVYD